MSTGAILFLAGAGAILALIMWRVSTLQTGPEGYTLLDSFTELRSANVARGTLEGAGIRVILEDHRRNGVFRGTALPKGAVNLFVPKDEVRRAGHLLKGGATNAHPHGPPA